MICYFEIPDVYHSNICKIFADLRSYILFWEFNHILVLQLILLSFQFENVLLPFTFHILFVILL